MKKAEQKRSSSGMKAEYDFSKGVRGKYAKRFAQGSNIVVLEPDVARLFHSSEVVNRALRSLVEVAKEALPREK